MGQLFALLFGASYGLSNVFVSKAVGHNENDKFIGQYITLLINSIFNIIILIVYLIFDAKITINFPGVLFFSVAGFFNSFLSRGIFLMSIPYIGVSRAGVFKITSPLFAIIGGVVILNETLNEKALIATIVIIIGILYVSLETIRKNQSDESSVLDVASSIISIPRKGIILGLLSGLLLGIGNVFRKIGISYIPSSIFGVTLGSLIALFSSVIFQALRGKTKELLLATKNIDRNYFISGVFSSIALYCIFIALKYIPVSYANSIGASESLFTMLWSLVICGNKEILTIRTLVGAIIVIAGITMLMIFI